MKKSRTKAEKEHLDKLTQIGCIVCGGPACIHHIRDGQGMGQKSSDFEAIPLCYYHHQGAQGIHHLGTKRWQKIYGEERTLLARALRRIEE